MSINITEYATCATCKGDFHDTELITMFVVFEDRPQMHPMLHHVECLECHHELHHKGDPNPETCGTLRDLRDGTNGLHRIRQTPWYEPLSIEVEDGDRWLDIYEWEEYDG